MAPGTTYRDPLTLGLRLVIILPQIPVVAMVFVILAIDEDTSPGAYVFLTLLFSITVAGTLRMHAFLTFRADTVRVGFMPMFWRTIPYREIATVDAIEVDPMRDYSGWGIKGRSTKPKGMLFSGGARNGIRITLRDGRRYVVTLPDPVDDIVAALRARGVVECLLLPDGVLTLRENTFIPSVVEGPLLQADAGSRQTHRSLHARPDPRAAWSG